ncbi:MAG: hypothetical protein K1Y36_19090 [Blastocatellia bacterium]|nr:hypothetical protein [Blastocatellia bacterium]
MPFSDSVNRFRQDVVEWCAGRAWHWRMLVLCYCCYAGFNLIIDEEYWTVFGGITFGIHELGHVIFGFLGHFLMVAGGTIAQLAAPLLTILLFLRQREYFGMAVGGSWLSASLCSVGTYLADARRQQLPLFGLGDDPQHDWTYLLSQFGLLRFDTKLAIGVRVLAFLVLAVSIAWGSWICFVMKDNPQKN